MGYDIQHASSKADFIARIILEEMPTRPSNYPPAGTATSTDSVKSGACPEFETMPIVNES